MDASTRFDTQNVGSLPVIAEYLDRLKIADHVNELVPWEGEVPLGTLVEVMICNRLLNPKAMFRIDDWAQGAAVTEYFGLEAGQLNDDRLGRALERIAVHSDSVQTAAVLTAIKEFKLDVSQVHYDITGIELYGAYEMELAEGETPPKPTPAYGRTKSGRKNVKQIQVGVNVTGDGGVPIGHLPLDGNAAEAPTHLDNLRRLRTMLPKQKLLYIADTKLDTPENLLTVAAHDGRFLCGGAFSPQLKERFLKQRDKLRPVAYSPKSQQKLPPEERDQYKALEATDCLQGVIDGQKHKLKYRPSAGACRRQARNTTRETCSRTRSRKIAKDASICNGRSTARLCNAASWWTASTC